MKLKIFDKNTIHLYLNKNQARRFCNIIEELLVKGSSRIDLRNTQHKYRGKKLAGINFNVSGGSESVYFLAGILHCEIEKEMAFELKLIIEKAIENNGLETAEIISFTPRTKKDVSVTICGFWEN